jgi:DNA-binding PadR family transcriptional regulator
MALEHALLVALRERAGSGSELARRFDRTIGFFWSATHQQIYRTLGRMESDGWVTSTVVPQQGKPDSKVYEVSDLGAKVLAEWLIEPSTAPPMRTDLGVRLRGASYADDPAAVLDVVRAQRADHATRLEVYRELCAQQFPNPGSLTGPSLDRYLVLRGGIRLEEGMVGWLTEYLTAHEMASSSSLSPANTAKDAQ